MNRFLIFVLLCISCNDTSLQRDVVVPISSVSGSSIVVLGTAQDGGSPHIGCSKDCCRDLWLQPDNTRKVVSLGVYCADSDQVFILDASPDFTTQLSAMNAAVGRTMDRMPDGIFLTHAHIGHYTGLMYLGREAKGASGVPVYAMPNMANYLSNNGPWDQLVKLKNIDIMPLRNKEVMRLSPNMTITPIAVPHRDEYSETVGFVIRSGDKSALFIPDIDKWEIWEDDIQQWISEVDYAFLDATFYDSVEINNRDMAEIPHPFVVESISAFSDLSPQDKSKIYFIHLNHTNPVWDINSAASSAVQSAGHHVAQYGQVFSL